MPAVRCRSAHDIAMIFYDGELVATLMIVCSQLFVSIVLWIVKWAKRGGEKTSDTAVSYVVLDSLSPECERVHCWPARTSVKDDSLHE